MGEKTTIAWTHRTFNPWVGLLDKAHSQGVKFFFKQITAPRSEQGADALGQIYHEMPDPPHSVWADGKGA